MLERAKTVDGCSFLTDNNIADVYSSFRQSSGDPVPQKVLLLSSVEVHLVATGNLEDVRSQLTEYHLS